MNTKINSSLLILATILFLGIWIILKNRGTRPHLPDIAKRVYEYPDNTSNNNQNKIQITNALILANSTTSRDANNEDIEYVHYIITIMLNTTTDLLNDLTLKSTKITNINIKYSGPGKIKIIPPAHIRTTQNLNYYLTTTQVDPFQLPIGPKTIVYKLSTSESPEFYDEISKYNTGVMKFAIAIIGVGKYNRQEIYNKYGKINSTQVFKYAQIKPRLLDANLSFDVIFVFNNNQEEKHHITAHINGEDLYKYGYFNATDADIQY